MNSLKYRGGRYWRDGEPFFVVAADYQYYRDREAHWSDRLEKLKASGVNTITFYIPWRHHLRVNGDERVYDFTGTTKDSRDVVGFMRRIAALGLWMIAKPGPFVHSELNVGGLPDIVSPSFNGGIPAARRHHGRPAYWTYDASQLPAPLDEHFDALAREWLESVREVLQPFAGDDGALIGIQLNDETIFCTSNDPPWHFGYDPSGIAFYRQLLRDRYGDIENYNRLHATSHTSFELVNGPALVDDSDAADRETPARPEEILHYIDWAEYQWRLRRDLYIRYKEYLGVSLPHLTNYAGITPPIEENVPDLQDVAHESLPPDYTQLYPEWWFAMNRIDRDADAYEYGMISWLGVASYDRDVFDRYINTARRARGINMEENWGFGMLYDAKSRYPLVPFYQTLVSVAGGATGYVIFCGVSTDYWEDELDRITKKQCPTFPSHAPIDEHGNCRPMYDAAMLLNRWFLANGEALLRCEPETDVCYLLYPPYAAVSSWIPDERYWQLDGRTIPRCGHEGFEEFSRALQGAGYSFGMFELDAVTSERLDASRVVTLRSAFFMDAASQEKLAQYVSRGGKLILCGDLPEVDLELRPCSVLRQAIDAARAGGASAVVYQPEDLFIDGGICSVLEAQGLKPTVTYADNMRAYVHRGAGGSFVFFFDFELEPGSRKWIEFDGLRIDFELGSKTCGALRVRDGRIISHLVKGTNEVEDVRSTIRIRCGDQVIEGVGDFASP